MAINDFNQKYTIERYCSKMDIVKIFGTNLIEPIWKEINDFRKRLSIELPFFDASRNKFYLAYIDPIQAKTAQGNEEVTSFVSHFSKIAVGSIAQYTFTREMLKISIKEIAKYNNLDVSEIVLTNILEGQEVGEEFSLLVNYFNALNELRKNSFGSIDEEFLAKNYAILRGEQELTSFYRTSDSESLASRAIIDRDYDNGVPAHLIDDLMPPLFDYINNFDLSLVSRLSAIFFIFNYVKPFESHNMELACLLAKRVIATTNIDTACVYVPLESFINDYSFFNDVSKEVKKTHDFTYAFLSGFNLLNSAFEIAISRMSEVRANSLDSEVKMGDNHEKIKEEFEIKVELPKRVEKTKETKSQIQARYERNAPKIEETPLTDKELKAKIEDLLESDPYLKRKQAHFYVYHSTIGKYYTIQQYVKFEKCVYETARTSMDLLAKQGYYRRDNIKNKFVYTPINKE